ncbi:MAG: hypothetical protein HOO96_20585 [Polyangiaceae bacterium]|nr:hypothetical protein [Polyangiaceae bacterium]
MNKYVCFLLSAGVACGGRVETIGIAADEASPGTPPGPDRQSSSGAPGSRNRASYTGAEVDAAAARCGAAPPKGERPATYAAAQEGLIGEWYDCTFDLVWSLEPAGVLESLSPSPDRAGWRSGVYRASTWALERGKRAEPELRTRPTAYRLSGPIALYGSVLFASSAYEYQRLSR